MRAALAVYRLAVIDRVLKERSEREEEARWSSSKSH
jgi:hypothetical protein